MKGKALKFLVASVFAMILLAACSGISSIRKVWVCVNPENGFDCHYSLFTGEETNTLKLDEGNSVNLAYDLEVVSGELQIKILDPSDQVLWQFDAIEATIDAVEVQVSESGRYSIVIVGDKAVGSFNILWDVTKKADS